MTTKDGYIYIPVEKLNPGYWFEKFDAWLYEVDESNKEAFRESIANGFKTVFIDWGTAAWNWFVSVTPDLVGYTAMFCGGLMILAPLVNRSFGAPLGLFGAVAVFGIGVVGG